MYTIGKEFQQRNSFFRSMTIRESFFCFRIAFVTCLFCTWNRSHEKWIWVVDFHLWILIQPCYASRAPNALAQIAFPWEKNTPNFVIWVKERKNRRKNRNAKALNCYEGLFIKWVPYGSFYFLQEKKRIYALFHFPHSKFHSEFSFSAQNASTALHIARHTSMRKSASNTRWKWENVERFIIKKI